VSQSQSQSQTAGDEHLPGFDPRVPSPARMWNFWLGGKDNFAADRDAGQRVLEVLPSMPAIARAARLFLADAVTQLAADHGVRQFLDIGTGLPTADNTHDVAQRVAPEAKIVYVDYDPVVLTHAQALLTSSPEGKTDYIQADLRDTATILADAARTLDFSRPIAVILIGILHFIPDADDPYQVVARLMAALPSGSYLVMAHAASDIDPEAAAETTTLYNAMSSATITMRSREQVARFFDGLELVPPGLVPMAEWGAPSQADTTGGLLGYSGIGRKPLPVAALVVLSTRAGRT
jgi:O-methyltransferase involved in polyketide biosynthesis